MAVSFAHGQDTSAITEKRYPLYEEYPFFRDYRVNQTALDAAKYGIIGASLLGVIAYMIEGPSEFPILTATGLALGGSLGAFSGSVYGFTKGVGFNRRRKSDPDFHARTRNWGLEAGVVEGFERDGVAISHPVLRHGNGV